MSTDKKSDAYWLLHAIGHNELLLRYCVPGSIIAGIIAACWSVKHEKSHQAIPQTLIPVLHSDKITPRADYRTETATPVPVTPRSR